MRPPARRIRVQLAHPMTEGEEIHAVLPETYEEWEAAIACGELKELPGESWRDVFAK